MRDPRRVRRLSIILIVIVAALAAAAALWVLWQGDVATTDAPEARRDTTTSTDALSADATTMSDVEPDDSATDTGPADAVAPAPSERVPAFVESVRTEAGATILTVDYIQFLTGDEAAAAASERGDESPPPNDYYIVNDNTRLREFAVQAGISVVTVVNDDGTSDPGGHELSLTEWVARLSGPNGDAFRYSFYWLTVSGDTITTIEQQYLP